MVEALVEYEYIAEQDDELTLKPGDIITNVIKEDGGWWRGTKDGKTGMFPDNFVKEITKFVDKPKKEKPSGSTKTSGASSGGGGAGGGGSSVSQLAHNLQISLDKQAPPGAAKRPGNTTARKKLRAKVTYSYSPQNEDELELKIGDVVEIENKEEEGWWEGNIHGRKGVFPSNFVDLMVEDDAATAAEPSETPEEEFKEIKGKKPKGFGFGNIFASAGGADVLNKVKKSKSQEDNISAEPKSMVGKKSASVRESSSAEPPTLPSRDKPAAKQPPAPPPKVRPAIVPAPHNDEPPVEKARVLYPYTAENEDELTLAENEIIVILDKELEDSGWWKGQVDGRVGVFPDNFVELIVEEKPKRPAPPMPTPAKSIKSKSPTPQQEKDHTKNVKETPSSGATTSTPHTAKGGIEPTTSVKKPGPPLLTKKPTISKPSENAQNLIHQTDDHKVQEQKTGLYIDTAEPNPPLNHITKQRPKAPGKRPPGQKTKESSPEAEVHNGPVPVPERPPAATQVKLENHSPRQQLHGKLEKQTTVHAAGGVSSAELSELRHDLESLRANTVPRKQHEALQKHVEKLQTSFDEMSKKYERKFYDLMCEIDEEKKLRQNALVEMERVKKLLAPK